MAIDYISKFREEYGIKSLTKANVDPNPMAQFQQWFDQALSAQLPEPNAMTLATVDQNNQPSIRVVLLKGIQPHGLIFYTNYQSRKARDLKAQPQAALNFFWQPLERQVRFEGKVEKLSADASSQYFQSRPRGSQIGAWVSPQSEPIGNREFLKAKLAQYETQFEDQEIPRPEHWGGYLLVPQVVEFWQGGAHRLHDRLQYQYQEGRWLITRLAP